MSDSYLDVVASENEDGVDFGVNQRTLSRERRAWQTQYQEEIEKMYTGYLEVGRHLFGNAFFQLGGIAEFADFVFKYTQPGA